MGLAIWGVVTLAQEDDSHDNDNNDDDYQPTTAMVLVVVVVQQWLYNMACHRWILSSSSAAAAASMSSSSSFYNGPSLSIFWYTQMEAFLRFSTFFQFFWTSGLPSLILLPAALRLWHRPMAMVRYFRAGGSFPC